VVTKREQHERLEERVLEAIRAGRPERAGDEGEEGAAHVERLRELMRLRKSRGEDAGAEQVRAHGRQQITFALQILFAVVAVAALALLSPVDWQRYFQSGTDAWRAKR
jgi:hypothetical protein